MKIELPVLHIDNPCQESWSAMQGSDVLRHCEKCAKNVYDFSKMSPRKVLEVVVRVAAGEPVCARLTKRDGELVMLPEVTPGRVSAMAGAALSAAMAVTLPMAAQEAAPGTNATAVLRGKIVRADGSAFGPFRVVTLSEGSHSFRQTTQADGSFEARVEPGTYDVSISGALTIPAAVLHPGVQELGTVVLPERMETVTLGGPMVSRMGSAYWAKHPLIFFRVLVKRIELTFSRRTYSN